MPAQIEVDDLSMPGQPGEVRLKVRVVLNPGPAVNQHDRRPLPHLAPVRHQRRPIHVEPQSRPIHVKVHRAGPSRCAPAAIIRPHTRTGDLYVATWPANTAISRAEPAIRRSRPNWL
jgi:hypothetical protein